MNVIDAINKRTSVRKYRQDKVDDKLISEIIDAARLLLQEIMHNLGNF